MSKVVSTRLSETEHKKLLDKCKKRGCNSTDRLRDIVLEFLNGNQSKRNVLGVLTADKNDVSNIEISSSRYVELNDANLVGLIATKEQNGKEGMSIFPPWVMMIKIGI
jgi:hypothetical protein